MGKIDIKQDMKDYFKLVRRFLPSYRVFLIGMIELTLLIIAFRMLFLYFFDKDYLALIFYAVLGISLKISLYRINPSK